MAEFQTQLESQVAQQVEAKMNAAHARIDELSTALQQLQNQAEQSQQVVTADLQQVKAEAAFSRTKMQEIEQSVATSGTMLLKQMENMFQTMQSSIQNNIEQALRSKAGSAKRLCTEPPCVKDAFATKS